MRKCVPLCILFVAPLFGSDREVFHPTSVEVWFSPKGGCTEACCSELDAAKKTIYIQAYSFTSAPIAKALVAAQKRGVKIEVILDKSQKSEKYTEADFVAHAGMKSLRLLSILMMLLFAVELPALAKGSGHSSSGSHSGSVNVRGYTKKDGTYVAPHHRSAPNSTKEDNWSTKGNVNPYTGKEGTKNVAPNTSNTPNSETTTSAGQQPSAGMSAIRNGMTKDQVRAILGSPNIEGSSRWSYSGKGFIEFQKDRVVNR